MLKTYLKGFKILHVHLKSYLFDRINYIYYKESNDYDIINNNELE